MGTCCQHVDVNAGETITPLKLQKLLYAVQGWNLVFNGKVMYGERIEAWAHGPVVAQIYNEFKEHQVRMSLRFLP